MKRTLVYCMLAISLAGCQSATQPEKAAPPVARMHLKKVDTNPLLNKIKTADSASDKELKEKYGRYKGSSPMLRLLDSFAHTPDSVMLKEMRRYRKRHHPDTVLKKA